MRNIVLRVIFFFSVTLSAFGIPVMPKENAPVVKVPVYVENVDAIRKEQRQILLEQYRADYAQRKAQQVIAENARLEAEKIAKAKETARIAAEKAKAAKIAAEKKAAAEKAKQQKLVETSDSFTGYAPHYSPGVMERVSRNRGLPIVNCMVSSPYQKIGTWLRVTSLIDGDSLDCRVTDVSAPKDRPRHIASRWAVELDWNSAKILCNINKVGQEPPRKCPVTATVLSK